MIKVQCDWVFLSRNYLHCIPSIRDWSEEKGTLLKGKQEANIARAHVSTIEEVEPWRSQRLFFFFFLRGKEFLAKWLWTVLHPEQELPTMNLVHMKKWHPASSGLPPWQRVASPWSWPSWAGHAQWCVRQESKACYLDPVVTMQMGMTCSKLCIQWARVLLGLLHSLPSPSSFPPSFLRFDL